MNVSADNDFGGEKHIIFDPDKIAERNNPYVEIISVDNNYLLYLIMEYFSFALVEYSLIE